MLNLKERKKREKPKAAAISTETESGRVTQRCMIMWGLDPNHTWPPGPHEHVTRGHLVDFSSRGARAGARWRRTIIGRASHHNHTLPVVAVARKANPQIRGVWSAKCACVRARLAYAGLALVLGLVRFSLTLV
jgi:hypothetical protein